LQVGAGFICDFDFGDDGVGEGGFVKGVQEAVQVFAFRPDDAAGHEVNYGGKDDGDPLVVGISG
jgi:hypothetical protein